MMKDCRQGMMPCRIHYIMCVAMHCYAGHARRITMAKGQQRGNKETKKPKKSKDVVVPTGFITPSKPSMPQKNKH
jgi:hypothetical protein